MANESGEEGNLLAALTCVRLFEGNAAVRVSIFRRRCGPR